MSSFKRLPTSESDGDLSGTAQDLLINEGVDLSLPSGSESESDAEERHSASPESDNETLLRLSDEDEDDVFDEDEEHPSPSQRRIQHDEEGEDGEEQHIGFDDDEDDDKDWEEAVGEDAERTEDEEDDEADDEDYLPGSPLSDSLFADNIQEMASDLDSQWQPQEEREDQGERRGEGGTAPKEKKKSSRGDDDDDDDGHSDENETTMTWKMVLDGIAEDDEDDEDDEYFDPDNFSGQFPVARAPKRAACGSDTESGSESDEFEYKDPNIGEDFQCVVPEAPMSAQRVAQMQRLHHHYVHDPRQGTVQWAGDLLDKSAVEGYLGQLRDAFRDMHSSPSVEKALLILHENKYDCKDAMVNCLARTSHLIRLPNLLSSVEHQLMLNYLTYHMGERKGHHKDWRYAALEFVRTSPVGRVFDHYFQFKNSPAYLQWLEAAAGEIQGQQQPRRRLLVNPFD